MRLLPCLACQVRGLINAAQLQVSRWRLMPKHQNWDAWQKGANQRCCCPTSAPKYNQLARQLALLSLSLCALLELPRDLGPRLAGIAWCRWNSLAGVSARRARSVRSQQSRGTITVHPIRVTHPRPGWAQLEGRRGIAQGPVLSPIRTAVASRPPPLLLQPALPQPVTLAFTGPLRPPPPHPTPPRPGSHGL